MSKTIIKVKNAPQPVGPYNQAVRVDNLVFTAGQIPIDPKTGELVKGGIAEQTRQVLTNLKAVLEESGSSLDSIIKATVFLKNMNDFPGMNAVYGEFIKTETAPARSTLEVARIPKDSLVEIEAVAQLKEFTRGNLKLNSFVIFALCAVLLTGCSTTKVERVPVEKQIDLSGRWNDTDARMVSSQMIKDCLEGNWINEFNKTNGRNPVVIVGSVDNKSSEHIEAAVFVKSLEAELINSGKVTFVASKTERPEVRDERVDQNKGGWTDPATIKAIGKETGADFMLRGSIYTVTDDTKGKYAILYQVNLELIDMTTNQVKWMDQTELKKIVQKSKYSL